MLEKSYASLLFEIHLLRLCLPKAIAVNTLHIRELNLEATSIHKTEQGTPMTEAVVLTCLLF
jgi:hypothetical protein